MENPTEIGPFRISGTLGAGGMGKVYLAVHRDTGERCALKTVKPDGGMGVDALRALRREVYVLAELDHPHIVKVRDFDLECDTPWFAMEYIEGRPFSDWNRASGGETSTADTILEIASRTSLEDWDSFERALDEAREEFSEIEFAQTAAMTALSTGDWEPGPELRTKLNWLGQIARALEFLHGLNIVHGDVKPDNVLIRNDGVAVLVDFGLVSRRGRRVTRQTLERSLTRAQTLEYAAPERHLKADYDARADIYSLGCMLYELFAGTPPFTGMPSAVAIAHVTQPPPPIENVAEPPPVRMWAHICELLRKRPEDRTPYAIQLCATLEDYAVATTAPGQSLPASRPYLYQPAFLGFGDQVDRAKDALHQLSRGGAPALVEITGPEGSGKSRFLLEVTADAVQSKSRVHVISTDEAVRDRLPFASLRLVLDELFDQCVAGEWLPRGDGVWLARIEPRLKDYLDAVGREQLEEFATVSAAAATRATASAVAQAMRTLAGSKGIVLVVESLDELESGTRAVVDEAIRRSSTETWLVVATSRRASDSESTGDERGLTIELPPLADDDIATLTAQILGGTRPDAETVALLRHESKGRPAAVVDLIHAMLEQRLIEQDARGRWSARGGEPLGSAMRELIATAAAHPERRLANLSGTARAVAELCAIFGDRARLADLFAVGSLSEGQVVMGVNELVRANVLKQNDRVGVELAELVAFSTQQMREKVYDVVAPERRVRLHRAAAEVVAERDDFVALAQHLELAEEPRRAFDAWLDAARVAREQFARELQARSIERAVRVGDWLSDEEREDLLLDRFLALSRISSTDVIVTESKGLLAVAKQPTVRAHVLKWWTDRMFIESRPEAVDAVIPEIRALAQSEISSVAVRANITLSKWYWARDEHAGAIAHAETAKRASLRDDDLMIRTAAFSALGNAYYKTNRLRESAQVMEQASKFAWRLGDRALIRSATGRVVAVRAALGDYAEITPALTPIAEFQRRASMHWELIVTLWNMAEGDMVVGTFDTVFERLDEMNSLREELGVDDDDAPYLGMDARVRAILAIDDERQILARAERAVDVARSSATQMEARFDRAAALTMLGHPDQSLAVLGRVEEPERFAHGLERKLLASLQAANSLDDLDLAARYVGLALAADFPPYERALLELEQGRLARRSNQLVTARKHLHGALAWFDEHRLRYGAAMARAELAHCLQMSGADSGPTLEPAIEYVDSQRFSERSQIRRALVQAIGRG